MARWTFRRSRVIGPPANTHEGKGQSRTPETGQATTEADTTAAWDTAPQEVPIPATAIISASRLELGPNQEPRPPVAQLDPATALMRFIGEAIDRWAVTYEMQNLPRDIILEQALMGMTEALRAAREAPPQRTARL